jgi:hypothetical protein
MTTQATRTAQLSRGEAIEYKAYLRSFSPPEGGAAVLCFYLVATCYYRQSGFTIYFEPDSGSMHFRLMEKSQSAHRPVVTYHVVSWTSGQPLDNAPAQVSIADAHGDHQVVVTPWS